MSKTLLSLATILFLALGSLTISAHHSSSMTAQAATPETVVLIHGLGRSNMAMWKLASRLEEAGYEVHRVGYSSFNTTSDEVIADISQQINDCCAQNQTAVHFVGHSLGGLLIRAYLRDNQVSNLGRVVMIGTPNNGTGVADRYKDHCLINLIPIAAALGTDESSFPNSLPRPNYPVGIIAGSFAGSVFDENDLPGRDDGVVPVESTKLEGMTDFIEVESGHSMLRYNDEVAQQTITFLREQTFTKSHIK